MSQHTLPPSHARSLHRNLPRGRAKLVAFEVAVDLAGRIAALSLPRGLSHLRDHLVRAADNTALRISEASGRTLGNRYQHLEAAYAENQEVQSDLVLLQTRRVEIPEDILRLANRLGGLIYGLLRAELRDRSR
jgi:four helix bundle protein